MTLGTNTWRQTFEITSRPASPSCQTSPMLTPRDFTPPELYDLTPRTLPANCAPSNVCVWVDAGHGGSATGALSPHGWTEKEINLLTAKAFCVELEKAGFRVKMTRTNDTFCALYQRPLEATRRGADLFISIHHNACACDRDPRKIRHTVSYASNSNGLELASCLQTELARALPNIPSRGALLKSLAVCRNPVLPSCLVEVDFINLPSGEEESWQGSRLLAVAKALTRGVLSYIEGRTACDK